MRTRTDEEKHLANLLGWAQQEVEQQKKTIEKQGRELAALRYERSKRDERGRLIEKLERRVAALKRSVRDRIWSLQESRRKWERLAFELYELIPDKDKLPARISNEFEVPF